MDSLPSYCKKNVEMGIQPHTNKQFSSPLQKGESECEESCEFLYYTSLYKAGGCPRPETATGFEAVCLASCRVDSDCTELEHAKCCPNLCGYVCRTPDYTHHSKYMLKIQHFLTQRLLVRFPGLAQFLMSDIVSFGHLSLYADSE